jgi:hypothetical protein
MLPATGLFVLALSWCGRELTDGFIPCAQIARLAGRNVPRLVGALVAVGLWDVVDGGYQIHDFLDYNRSRTEVLAERGQRQEVRARAGALGGRRSVEVRRQRYGTAQPPRSTEATLEAHPEATAEAMLEAAPKPPQSPVPVPVPKKENSLRSHPDAQGPARLSRLDFE